MSVVGKMLKGRWKLYLALLAGAPVLAFIALFIVAFITADDTKRPTAQSDQLSLKGRLIIEVYGPDGKLRERREVNNVVLDLGKEGALVTLFSATHPSPTGLTFGPFIILAVGSSDGVPADASALASELFRLTRLTVPLIDTANNCVSQSYQRGVTLGFETYKEAGLAATSVLNVKPLLNRVTFAAVNKTAGGSVAFTMTICMP